MSTLAPTEPSYWVYALDEWDARDQITRALCIDANDETLFVVIEIVGLSMPLDLIRHSTGEWTTVPVPKMAMSLTPYCGTKIRVLN
jgi:hypothetical protein